MCSSIGTLEINEDEAETVRMIFDYYLAGASLGKVVDMLFKKQILSPTGKFYLEDKVCSRRPM